MAASPAATLSPGADPAVAFALTSSREELVQRRVITSWEPQRKHGTATDGLPPVLDIARSDHWADDIRVENCITELMQPLHLSVSKKGVFSARHVVPKIGANGAWGAVATHRIVEISRPPVALFEAQTQGVFDMSDLRNERMAEIVNQIGIPMQFWASIVDLNATDKPRTLELLSIALQCLSHVNQIAKHAFGCPRPTAYSPSIQPMINPRRFGAFPCGHAAEAFLVARLLQELSGQCPFEIDAAGKRKELALRQQLQRLAKRISDNRVVAGVHFQIDNVGGRMVGETIAEYVLFRCRGDGWQARKFVGEKTLNDKGKPLPELLKDFDRHQPMDKSNPAQQTLAPYFAPLDFESPLETLGTILQAPVTPAKRDTLLGRAWERALAEWTTWPRC